ncbi:MAG: hypothetical protein CO139_03255 [Candidatus Moranbacteria bacterium CG_4_9_14_3_um_filter_36_9]|nr:MAG: hypothetical protein CO139_03255 [Candidatus Moranbacteria bacterium CG_4_9_14_3_um_filter_36_9]
MHMLNKKKHFSQKINFFISLLFFILSLFALSLNLAHATGNTIYVDDDNEGGTENGLAWATAYGTITEGIADTRFKDSTGNTVLVKAGTYNEIVTLTSVHAGESGAPNIIQANPGDTPIVDAQDTRNQGFNVGFSGGSADYITIDGFEVKNATTYGNIFVYSSQNVTIKNNTVHDSGGAGIYATVNSHNIIAQDNTVYNINNASVAPYGIYLQRSNNAVASGNTVYNIKGSGIECENASAASTADNCQVYNNTVYDAGYLITLNNVQNSSAYNNTIYITDSPPAYVSNASGIILNTFFDISYPSTGNIIRDNIIYNSGGPGVWLMINSANLSDPVTANNTVRNNIVYDSLVGIFNDKGAINNNFYNNTLYNNGTGIALGDNGSVINASGSNVKNNIVSGSTIAGIDIVSTGHPTSLDYNLYYNNAVLGKWHSVDYNTLAGWQTVSSGDTNTLISDPQFLDAGNNDFHPLSTSAAINGGSDVSLTYYGAAPDIGHWQQKTTSFAMSGLASSVTAGSATSATVTVSNTDQDDTVYYGYRGTVAITSSDSNASVILPANYAFVLGDTSGVHNFSNAITLITKGSQTVTTTDSVDGTLTDNQVTTVGVSTASASLSTVSVADASLLARNTETTTITVTPKDAYENNFGTGQTVSLNTDIGSISAVVDGGNSYTATYTAPNVYSSTSATITAVANGVTLTTKPTISFTDLVPTDLSISIKNGDNTTDDRRNSLTLGATNATQMMLSNSADFSGAVWQDYATSISWKFTSGNGTKTIYVKFKNAAGDESEIVSDTIKYKSSSSKSKKNFGRTTTTTQEDTPNFSTTSLISPAANIINEAVENKDIEEKVDSLRKSLNGETDSVSQSRPNSKDQKKVGGLLIGVGSTLLAFFSIKKFIILFKTSNLIK